MNTVAALAGARALQRRRDRRLPASPAALGRRIVRDYRITPAVALISDVLVDAITHSDRRVIISVPPRESKSTTVAVLGTLFAMSRDHDESVILASYADALALEHSRTARDLADEHADLLGLRLSRDKTSTARWQLDGARGGLLAVGVGSSVTGFGCGLLICDDVVKNAAEADSPAARKRTLNEFRATLLTRVHPGGSVVIIGTRWAEDDLIGGLLRDEPERWRYINVPAVAELGIPDSLGRRVGVSMTSAMGRTRDQFEDLRRSVGSRTWSALYQGAPSPVEGGLIKAEWIEGHRVAIAPQRPLRTVVAVDPADSGERDAAGVVAASVTDGGTVAVIADRSAKMTSDEWARAAIALALDVGASEIHVEAFSAGTTYVRVVREAVARTPGAGHISVRGWPPKGSPRKGDAVARAAGLLQGLETGRCVIAGMLPGLEQAMVQWQAGQHQPDSVAAAVIAFDVLAPVAGQQFAISSPLTVDERLAQRDPVAARATANRLTRRVSGHGYDPLAFRRPTIRGL